MANSNAGKYFVKNAVNGNYADICTTFDGVNVLSLSNIGALGKAVNVYQAKWVDSQAEDFMITGGTGRIIRENVDLKLTFICSNKYSGTVGFDVETAKDTFVSYMTGTDIWIRSKYYNKDVHCVCLDKYEPKIVKLQRGGSSFIIGEISLHCLDAPTVIPST